MNKSSRLLNAGRGSDIFFRQGGDEFVYAIMIERDNFEFIEAFDSLMRKSISPTMIINQLRLGVKTSIGHSISPIDGYSVTDLIRIADKNMYENKAKIKAEIEKSVPLLPVKMQATNSIVSLFEYKNK